MQWPKFEDLELNLQAGMPEDRVNDAESQFFQPKFSFDYNQKFKVEDFFDKGKKLFAIGNLEGKGTIVNTTGDIYEGGYDNYSFHGKGMIKFSNGDHYEG